MKPYYNTTHEKEKLKEYTEKAKTQDEVILAIFEANPHRSFSPSQILNLTNLKSPITSIRRSITNLTSVDLLVKTEEKVEGMYGRPEHTWKLNIGDKPQLSLF